MTHQAPEQGPNPDDGSLPPSPPVDLTPHEQPRKRRLLWWIAPGAVVAIALVVTLVLVFTSSSGVEFKHDPELQKALLSESAFPGYEVTVLGQKELDELSNTEQPRPDSVSPPECEQLTKQGFAAMDQAEGTLQSAGVRAINQAERIVYQEFIFAGAGSEQLNPSGFSQVFDKCSTYSATTSGQTANCTLTPVDAQQVGPDATSFSVACEGEGQSLTITLGVVQRNNRGIMLMSVGGTLPPEFPDLFAQAVEAGMR